MAYSETLKYFANEKGLKERSQEYKGGNLECKGREGGGLDPYFPSPLPSQERVILSTLLVNQNKGFRLILPSLKMNN